ncbi:hypothetical protein LCGC14_2804060 [marine sediment metagenome]|uniref:Chlorhexidine efflux transporter domain-containing protein n=1 Tax=marine sediment metagenome TaxID=412755 RepID=A0A0F9BD95_9ZZZZ
MRSTADRIRHAISFEILALLIVTPMGAWLFDKPLHEIGVVTVVSASIATGWNYLYNLGFAHALRRLSGTVRKTVPIRVLHAVTFEIGLLFVLMPLSALPALWAQRPRCLLRQCPQGIHQPRPAHFEVYSVSPDLV